ncbi:hypothetical protein Dsin_007341 [Dipteronia sinensis]|uniref:Uncharacterized protein n=1 Tax=Dipteronia sinensis TaxID=43782 RepID=A0AAE0B1L9_9ROSI|nr:hypothetical protein Dsin_007341 [Dipteronia sinensis]
MQETSNWSRGTPPSYADTAVTAVASKVTYNGTNNCIPSKADQRSTKECSSEYACHVDCSKLKSDSSFPPSLISLAGNAIIDTIASNLTSNCSSSITWWCSCEIIERVCEVLQLGKLANSGWYDRLGDLVEYFEKDGGRKYEIDSGSESETFDDDFIELEYEEIEKKGIRINGMIKSVTLEDEETGLDNEGEKRLDHSVAMDDEHKQAMKKLKIMDSHG